MYIGEVTEKTEDFKKPYDNYNYNYYVEYFFDFTIHGNVCVYKP